MKIELDKKVLSFCFCWWHSCIVWKHFKALPSSSKLWSFICHTDIPILRLWCLLQLELYLLPLLWNSLLTHLSSLCMHSVAQYPLILTALTGYYSWFVTSQIVLGRDTERDITVMTTDERAANQGSKYILGVFTCVLCLQMMSYIHERKLNL